MPSGDRLETDTIVSRDLAATRTASAPSGEPAPARTGLQRGASIGRFLLLERIGEGGMGSVWTAYDGDLDRKVALKLVRADRATDDDVRSRMVREAQALARLAHPNVVTVHEVGLHEGSVYLAMEYVHGETLKAWMAREPPGSTGRLSRMLGIMQQAGRGLAAAHAAGMVHRDFKPANVIVGSDGRVRVVDFGLARTHVPREGDGPGEELVATYRNDALRSSSGGSRVQLHESVTQTGTFIGTPKYMSPEQFEGQAIDARSDVFSFATVLFEATYGRSPWRGETASAMYSQMLDGPPSPPDGTEVPQWLTKAIRRGLSPRPSQRWPTMSALLDALTLPTERAKRSTRRWLAIAGVGLVAGLVPSLWLLRERPQPIDECAEAAARIDETWNADVGGRIEQAFGRTQAPYAAAAFASVAAELDQYTTEWSRAAANTCLDHRRSHEDSETIRTRASLECLELRRNELTDLLALYESADEATVERALDAASALTPISGCVGDTARSTRHEDPEILALRHELARAKTLGRLGKTDEARNVARDIADEAQQLGVESLAAQALLELGTIQTIGFAARTDLESAYWLAFGAADDDTALRTAITLVRRSTEIEGMSLWRRHATALLTRRPDDVDSRAALYVALGTAAQTRGEHELAAEYQEIALEALEARRDPMDLELLSAIKGIGHAYSQSGRHEEANTYLRRALEIIDARLGSDHPQAALVHERIGENELARGEFEAAERELRLTLAIYARNPNRDPRASAYARRALGDTLVFSGRIVEGIAELEAALDELPDKNRDRIAAEVEIGIGTALLYDGRASESIDYFLRAYEIERMHWGPNHPRLVLGLNRGAMAMESLGHIEAAMALTRRAIAILLASGNPSDAALHFASLGVLAQKAARWTDSIVYCRRAVELYELSRGQVDSRLAFPLRVMALSLLQVGRARSAIAPLERALVLHSRGTYDSRDVPKTKLALARALWDSRADRQRARSLALESKSQLMSSSRTQTPEFREASDWLERH